MRPAIDHTQPPTPVVEVIIEIPRGSFIKRGSSGQLDFISPIPCPFNYGSVLAYTGLDGDFLDAVVLGPRMPAGTRINVPALLAISLIDRGFHDDKLVCSDEPIPEWKKTYILLFFKLYAKAKILINFAKGHKGRNSCEGWLDAHEAVCRATPVLRPGGHD